MQDLLPVSVVGGGDEKRPCFEALLPKIHRLAWQAFRYRRTGQRQELVAEVVARAFVMFRRLVERGLAHLAYASALARYAIRQVVSGRRVGSRQNVRDVLSEAARRKHCFEVTMASNLDRDVWEQLTADKRSTPAEVAIFRLDFGAWLKRLDRAKYRAVERFLAGDTTFEAARLLSLSAGRISQLRRELKLDWQAFQGELPARPSLR